METKHKELQARILLLRESLLAYPDRPFWQVEFCNILLGYADMLDMYLDRSCSLNLVEQKLSSLENRYSELLYRMSDR